LPISAFLSASFASRTPLPATSASAYVSVSKRQHTSAYVSIRQHTSAYHHASAYVSIRQNTSEYAYLSLPQHLARLPHALACRALIEP
jgi:hypothetical protein